MTEAAAGRPGHDSAEVAGPALAKMPDKSFNPSRIREPGANARHLKQFRRRTRQNKIGRLQDHATTELRH